MAEYDVIVLGAGTAGESVIWAMHREGKKIAVIERELIGGLCAYWGCIPSKTLLRPGGIEWEAKHGFGVGTPKLDWPAISRYRDWMVRNWNDQKQVEQLRQSGIDFFRGEGMIAGPGLVKINDRTLNTKYIAVATGSVDSIPPIDGLKDVGYWTNREVTEMQVVPSSVLIVGGGAEGCEFAQIFISLGANVAIVEEAEHLLGHKSPDAAKYVQQSFENQGIKVHTGRKTMRFEEKDGLRVATLDNGQQLSAQIVVTATGRKACIEGYGLENVGIKASPKGIPIDEHCQAAENVWAMGDVTGVAGFTHVADYQGHLAVADMLGRPRNADYTAIPRVTYTDPEVAAVGQTDPKQMPPGVDLITASVDLDSISRTSTYGQELHGALCLYADRASQTLVGAWAAGPIAGEWIQFATLAIRARVPLSVLNDTILAFPTFTRGYLQPIHDLYRQMESN